MKRDEVIEAINEKLADEDFLVQSLLLKGVDPAWIAECYSYHLAAKTSPDDDDTNHVETDEDKELKDEDLGNVSSGVDYCACR